MNHLSVYLLACCCWLFSALGARIAEAGVVISIQNTQLSPSSNGFIDVLIHSDSGDTLSNFSFSLQIQQTGATATQLRFSTLQSDSQLNDANYVFAAGSLKRDGDPALLIDPEQVGSAFTEFYPRDSFVGTDSFTLLAPPSVTLTSTGRLLARLEIESAPGFLAPAAGDQFRVSLIDGPFTSFLDENLSALSYVSTSGTITVANVTAVPEPGTFSSALVGILIAFRQIRRRQIAH